jgi:hypothetical protein
MRVWKSTKVPPKHDIFVSEIRLKKCGIRRLGKVRELLKLLREDFYERVSRSN